MNTTTALRVGVATDRGRKRAINEDRVLVDDTRGIFLVVDGLGGHAAGEVAAETAVRVIDNALTSSDLNGNGLEEQIRGAIAEANNQIHALAQSNEEWRGMACVLTLAVAHDDQITVGHVGDSRLYLAWNGNLRKLTSDHSPVGEQEDQGELSEYEAMRHPRRNEVFRDVGSHPRELNDAEFVEIKNLLFRPDAALLLCSDGLSDVLTSAQISAILEQYDGRPESTARQLVEAANEGGGKDNISVVFVAGPEFPSIERNIAPESRPRHAVTRMRRNTTEWRAAVKSVLWVLAGMLIGILLWEVLERMIPRPAQVPAKVQNVPRAPVHIAVNPTDALGIINALSIARPGDTVEIQPGEYLGPIQLRANISLVSSVAGQATVRSSPTSVTDPGLAIVARGIQDARVQGVRIVSDDAHPLRTGIWVENSSVEINDVDVSGAMEAGIHIDAGSHGILLGNFVHGNPGAGIVITDRSAPRIAGNWISENGRVHGAPRAGIEMDSSATPTLERNVVIKNGLVTPGAK